MLVLPKFVLFLICLYLSYNIFIFKKTIINSTCYLFFVSIISGKKIYIFQFLRIDRVQALQKVRRHLHVISRIDSCSLNIVLNYCHIL